MISLLFVVSCILFFMFLVAGILGLVFRKHLAVQQRANRYFNTDLDQDDDKKLKKKRDFAFLKGYSDRLKIAIDKKMAKSKKRQLDNRLREAGYPMNLSAIDFRFLQVIIGGVLFFSVFLLVVKGGTNLFSSFFLASVVGALGVYYPSFYLSTIIKKRRIAIQKSMPDFFDMVNLSIEAGMGLDTSLLRVCHQMKGPLSDEFLQTLEDIRLGKSRREAFADLRSRVPVHQFKSIITSLIQADMLGVGMAKALRQLTVRIREQRTQFAREQAMKAPVKMVFPMLLFIFPAIFIVLMGPLVIYLIQSVL